MADQKCLNNESQLTSEINTESQITSSLENVIEVFSIYEGAETNDIIVNVDNSSQTISATLQKMWYASTDNFPAIGSSNLLYVDLETSSLYIWNEETISYDKVISDWKDIEEINGGNA